jgi:hypothetical protein
MAGTILKNIVSFTGLAVGVPTSLPHLLNVNGVPVVPTFGAKSAAGFTVNADDTNVTITRLSGPADVDVYVEYWHTIEFVTPLPDTLPFPFFVDNDDAAEGAGNASYLPGWWTALAWSAPSDQVMNFANNISGNLLPAGQSGSIVGIVAQVKQAITAGTLTVTVLDNGNPIASLVMTTGSPTFISFPLGANPFVAGDLLSVELDASADQAPSSSNIISVYLLWSPA